MKLLKLVKASDLTDIEAFKPPVANYLAAAFAPDGNTLCVAVAEDASNKVDIRLLDAHSGDLIRNIGSHKPMIVTGLTFLKDATSVISAGWDGDVSIWDTKTGKKEKPLQTDGTPVAALAVSRDGRWVAASGYDMQIRLWDLNRLGVRPRILPHGAVADALGFSADNERLLCAGHKLRDVPLARAWLEEVGDESGLTMHITSNNDLHDAAFERFEVKIPINTRTVEFDLRDQMIKQVRAENGSIWNKVKYENAFPALNDLTKHLQTTTTDELATHLIDQKKQSGEKFEVLGLKIPAGALTRASAPQTAHILRRRLIWSRVEPYDSPGRHPFTEENNGPSFPTSSSAAT